MHVRRARWALGLASAFAVLAAGACGGDEAGEPAPSADDAAVRDSAAVDGVSPRPPTDGGDRGDTGCTAASCPDGGGIADGAPPDAHAFDAAAILLVDGGGVPAPAADLAYPDVPCGAPGFPRTQPGGAVELTDLGHVDEPTDVGRVGNRVVSAGSRWILWDADTLHALASGPAVKVVFGGNRFVVRSLPYGFDVRAFDDGHEIRRFNPGIVSGSSWGISDDGAVFWAATSDDMVRAWSIDSGALLFERAGRYTSGSVYAAATELRVAGGPAGARIETIRYSDGAVTLSEPFGGTFRAWFNDGTHFITMSEDLRELVIYAPDGTAPVSVRPRNPRGSVGGHGRWVWAHGGSSASPGLDVYALGETVSTFLHGPARTFATSGSTLLLGDARTATVVRLDGPTVQSEEIAIGSGSLLRQMGADAAGRYAIGDTRGGVFTRAPASRPNGLGVLGCGMATSIAGVGDRLAVATAGSGEVFFHDLAALPGALTARIPFVTGAVALSASGGTLVGSVAGTPNALDVYQRAPGAFSLNVIDVPTRQLRAFVPASYDDDPRLGASRYASGGAGRISLSYVASQAPAPGSFTLVRRVLDLGTGRAVLDDTQSMAIPDNGVPTPPAALLSPGGRYAALPRAEPLSPGVTTDLYDEGARVGTVPGYALGWLDDDRLLAQLTETTDAGRIVRTFVYDARGQVLGTPPFPTFLAFAPRSLALPLVDGNHFLLDQDVHDLTTGTKRRVSQAAMTALAGGRLVEVVGPSVLHRAMP